MNYECTLLRICFKPVNVLFPQVRRGFSDLKIQVHLHQQTGCGDDSIEPA